MAFIGGLWLAVLGVLGAASLIIAKRPDAKAYIDKLTPYQGWIGAISAVVGILVTLRALFGVRMLSFAPMAWVGVLVDGLLLLVLGLLLGVGVLKSFIGSPRAQQRLDELIVKIAPYQGTLGLVAIVVGLWTALASIF